MDETKSQPNDIRGRRYGELFAGPSELLQVLLRIHSHRFYVEREICIQIQIDDSLKQRNGIFPSVSSCPYDSDKPKYHKTP